jgi:hypothetical protein
VFAWGARLHSKSRWVNDRAHKKDKRYPLSHHFRERPIADPPFMEFTLLVLGLSGVFLLWRGAMSRKKSLPKNKLNIDSRWIACAFGSCHDCGFSGLVVHRRVVLPANYGHVLRAGPTFTEIVRVQNNLGESTRMAQQV